MSFFYASRISFSLLESLPSLLESLSPLLLESPFSLLLESPSLFFSDLLFSRLLESPFSRLLESPFFSSSRISFVLVFSNLLFPSFKVVSWLSCRFLNLGPGSCQKSHDWVITKDLRLCRVLRDGRLLCPSKGQVAVLEGDLGSGVWRRKSEDAPYFMPIEAVNCHIRPHPRESTGSRPLSPSQTHESQIGS